MILILPVFRLRSAACSEGVAVLVTINGTNISVTRGDTLDITIEILYPDGSQYTVREGDVIRFALKQRYSDAEPLILKSKTH